MVFTSTDERDKTDRGFDVAEGFSLPLCFLKKYPAKGTYMGTRGGIRLMEVSFEEPAEGFSLPLCFLKKKIPPEVPIWAPKAGPS